MNKILKTSAAAVLAATLIPAAASAACNVDLSTADKAIGDRRDAYGPSAPDFRQLRDAARTLARYGKDGACESVVKAINEMAAAPPTYMAPGAAMAPAPGSAAPRPAAPAPSATPPAFQYDRMAAVKDARPLSEGGIISTESLTGATLYSAADGRSLGEIEDIVVGKSAADSFAIVGYGGFLGIGEKKVRVNLNDLMVNPAYNTYYVKMADADLKAAPGLRKVDGRWVDAAR